MPNLSQCILELVYVLKISPLRPRITRPKNNHFYQPKWTTINAVSNFGMLNVKH